MTQLGPDRPWLLEGAGDLILPAGAYFTDCHLTDAGRTAARDALAQHPEWRDEPAEVP
jgi:hypothetical protein